jgi:hypothetical protein
LFASYTKQAEDIISSVEREQADRFIEVMQSISHCCGIDEIRNTMPQGHDEVKYKKRKIYDTTILKAKEMCETFKGFNLTNSQALEQARASLEKALNGVTAEDIRDSDAIRHAVKEDVDSILGKFSSFGSFN